MARNPLLTDLGRALDLLKQIDENNLDFDPDPQVSPDIQRLTNLDSYPSHSHLANLTARIDAVISTENKLESREPSEYVSNLIIACVRLAPPSDD